MNKIEFDKWIDNLIREVIKKQSYNLDDFSYTAVKNDIYNLIKQQMEGYIGDFELRITEIIDCHLIYNKIEDD